jgi:four helix bundle protein
MEDRKGQEIKAGPSGIRDFVDLETYRMARDLRKDAYRISANFPKTETFGLTSQLRRAAISVAANIAEGFGRFSYQENIQFCRQSRASVYELRDHLITANDEGYVSGEDFSRLNEKAFSVIRLLNGYIRATKARKESQDKLGVR